MGCDEAGHLSGRGERSDRGLRILPDPSSEKQLVLDGTHLYYRPGHVQYHRVQSGDYHINPDGFLHHIDLDGACHHVDLPRGRRQRGREQHHRYLGQTRNNHLGGYLDNPHASRHDYDLVLLTCEGYGPSSFPNTCHGNMTWVCYTVVNALSYLGSKSLAKAAELGALELEGDRDGVSFAARHSGSYSRAAKQAAELMRDLDGLDATRKALLAGEIPPAKAAVIASTDKQARRIEAIAVG